MQRARRAALGLHPALAHEPLEHRVLLAAWTQEDISYRFLAARSAPFGAPDGVEVVGFGSAIAVLGDVNGDGIDDYAVSAPGTPTVPGFVAVYSGIGGAVPLWTATGPTGGFGLGLARIADLDGDGADDLIVGSPGVGDDIGRVEVRSGSTGLVILPVEGASVGALAGAAFGRSVTGTADTNNDGIRDLLVGAPFDGTTGAGRAYLLSGADGTLLRSFDGEQPGEHFGWAVAALFAADRALAIGAPGYDGDAGADAGRTVRITPDGTPVHVMHGSTRGGLFGFAVHALANFGSVPSELAIGAPLENGATNEATILPATGAVTVYDLSGTPRDRWAGKQTGGLFGYALDSMAADELGFDGATILAVGSPGVGGGLVSIFEMNFLGFELPFVPPPRVDLGRIHAINGPGATPFGASIALVRLTEHPFADLLVADAPTRLPDQGTPDETGGAVEVVRRVNSPTMLSVLGTSRGLDWIAFRGPTAGALFRFGPDGVVRFPPLPSDRMLMDSIAGVGADGALLVSVREGFESGNAYSTLIGRGGEWINLRNTVVNFVGAPGGLNFTPDMRALGLAPDDSVIVGRLDEATATSPAGHSVWRVHGDTAEYLWTGIFVGASEAAILGRRFDSLDIGTGEPFYTTALWRPGTGVELIPDIQNPGGVTADGRIVGVLFDTRQIAVRSLDGVVTPLFTVDAEHPVTIRPMDIDGDGRILWIRTRLTNPHFQPHPYSWSEGDLRMFDPALGFNGVLDEHVVGGPELRFLAGSISRVNRLTPNGGVVVGWGSWSSASGFTHYSPGIDEQLLGVAPFATHAVVAGPDSLWSAFVNERGGITILEQLPGGDWRARTAREMRPVEPFGGATAWIDPRLGTPHFFLGNMHVRSHAAQPDRVSHWTAGIILLDITASAVMIRPDGLAIVATLTADGEVVIHGQSADFDGTPMPLRLHDNLYDTQLRPKGLPTPRLVGAIDAYATQWGGHNIIGIDEHGDAWAIWNSHEIDGWVITNLSEWIGDVPPFRAVTAFITAWNAFNITGLNDNGELFTLWWAPELGHGNWRTDFIGFGAERFSLDAGIDSWHNTAEGSLNFVGLDEGDATVVYTWSVPNQTWRSEIVQSADAESPARDHAADPHGSSPHARTIASRTDDGAPVAFVRAAENDWLRLDLIEML